MLTASPQGHESPLFLHTEVARNKRLADVKRGTDYFKKVDTIAEAQWKSNVPKFPSMSRKVSVLPKITTSVMSNPEGRRSEGINMTSTPRQSFSMMSGTGSGVTAYTGTSMSLPSHISRLVQHHSTSQATSTPIDRVPSVQRESANFNPWGTTHNPLDDQTKLTADDLRPRELPFQYRDSRKLVIKPVPKRPMPMSRVATNERNRHQRTVTNFRSRNGTIRIIKPLDPLPETEKFQKSYKHELNFDLENMEREKTFAMLERIDRILHPNKKSPRPLIGSSEEELPGTSDSSVTLTEDIVKVDTHELHASIKRPEAPRQHVITPTSPVLTPRLEHSSLSKGRHSRSDRERVRRPRIKFFDDPYMPKAMSFKEVLTSLDTSQEDIDLKCQAWIDKCL